MVHLGKRFGIVLGVLVFVNAAGVVWIHHDLTKAPKPAVRLVSLCAQPSPAQARYVTLAFDRDLVAADRVGKVETDELFRLQPAWPGKWFWAARDRFEYRTDQPLPPGREFRIVRTDLLEARTGLAMQGPADLKLLTGALALESAQLTASDERDVTMTLTFNQPVDPPELMRNLTFFDDRASSRLTAPQCLTQKPDAKQVVRTPLPVSGRLRMVIGEKLKGFQAQLPLGQAVTQVYSVSPGFALLAAEVQTPSLEDVVAVRLRFSRLLGGEQKVPVPVVKPAVEKLEAHRSNNELVVSGEFQCEQKYTLTVPGTLTSQGGATLGADKDVAIEIPNRRCQLTIPHTQGVLAPHGKLMLDARAVNVPQIHLESWKLHANNLAAHLHGKGLDNETSRSIREKTVKLDMPRNVPQTIAVDLADLVQDRRGVYGVEAAIVGREWNKCSAVVAVTDLAITAKEGPRGLLVWITSLKTGQPAAGAEIKAVSNNNQVLATGKADEHGGAVLEVPANHPDGSTWLVTAEKDGDLSFLQLADNQWVIDEVDTTGRSRPETYEAMLYTERGVYRPGDLVHLTGIVRDRGGQVPAPFPLAIKVTRPDGRKVAELLAQPGDGAQGVFHADFASRPDGQTGPYTFRVTLPGDKEELGFTHASIEAFVPVRMEVKAKASCERYGPADAPRIEVSGRYLWDQPAAGVPLAVEGKLTAVAFESPAHKAFHFGSPAGAGGKGIEIAAINATLDPHGKAELAVPLPKDLAAGLYRMVLSATVTEVGGRSVSAGATAVVDRLDRHIGLRLPGGQVAPVGKAVPVEWVRLTGLAKPADAGEMKMTFSRVEYDTVLRQVDGRYVWQSTERLEQVSEKPIAPAGAAGSFEVICPEAGMYRLTVADAASTSSTQLDFHASQYAAEAQSVEMNRPERLEIVTDKDKYVPGETAKVVVRSPLSGTLLITLETDQVVWWQVAEVAKNTAELAVPIPADLRGGAFLVGSVVRAVDPTRKSWLPHRAMGMTRVRTDHSARRLAVTVAATAKARPGENVTINVEGATAADPARPAYVHLWAVDEGILLSAAYKTPDPMPFFLGQRGAGMSTADIFSGLLPDYERPAGMTHIGADGGGEGEAVDKLRRGPVDTKRLAPAVVWRAAAPAGPDGRLTVQMPMPDLTGQMRVMAVAVDGDRYGQAEQAVTLTQPLVVEATWPRFVAPDDTFQVPVKLFNSTDHPLTVRTEAHVTGPVTVAPDAELDHLVIRPGEPVLRFLQARATGVGDVQVLVEAKLVDDAAVAGVTGGPGDVFACHTTAMFPVRPAGTPHTETRLDSLQAGKNLPVVPSEAFVRGTIRATVDISPKPSVQLAPALERLIHYPYGCVEQTSSQLFSLLYAGDVLGGDRAAAILPMVQAGIARLWSMQTPSGGLAYWPGDTHPCLWGTAYASSCLLEARTAGHKIDEQFTKELTKYLTGELNNTGDRGDGAPDANTRALICRVLAAFGEPSHGWMARLAEQSDKLDQAGLAHLAGAYMAAGRKDRATALLPKEMPADAAETTTSGRLTSAVREDAVLLGVLMDIDPKHPLVVPLVARLEKARKDGWWGSTLENASAIAALSRYQVLVEAEKPDFTGTVRAGEAAAVPFRHDKPFSQKFENVTGPIEIASAGTGTVYVSVAFEGLAQKGAVKPYERSLKVERKWLTSAGKPVDPEKLHVGDLVRVELTVRSPRPASNVAVVDCLPGGLEVENPRLATSAPIVGDATTDGAVPAVSEVPLTPRRGRHAAREATPYDFPFPSPREDGNFQPRPQRLFDHPDHVEFLDDRVVLFCSAGPRVQTFSYALRVTAAGEFILPPIQASCMYDPAVACLGAEGKVKTAK